MKYKDLRRVVASLGLVVNIGDNLQICLLEGNRESRTTGFVELKVG